MHHRRWILRQAFSKNAAGISNHSDDTDIQIQAAITNELEGSRVAASGYPSNYNAWSHRIWTVKNLARSSTEVNIKVDAQKSEMLSFYV